MLPCTGRHKEVDTPPKPPLQPNPWTQPYLTPYKERALYPTPNPLTPHPLPQSVSKEGNHSQHRNPSKASAEFLLSDL